MSVIDKGFPTAALIDGKWITSEKVFPVLDPATGTEIAAVPNMGALETRRAIEAAHRALPAWRSKTAKERSDDAAAMVRSGDRGEHGRARRC